ncbi:LytTR family DNA-binding domain-containing protein [Actinomycetaceae bacterium MB13-C1-2]|nr:LytTR family DNA-binding domain-containing protein [Actinomycetaceae bacterium MB13-C1-2]
MSFRIAVVDDEASARANLLEYLDRYQLENDQKFDVRVFEDGGALLENYQPIYDIVFLDMHMPAVGGMATAEAIRLVDDQVILIFVTNLSQYAVKGYRVGAMSYLLKPVTYFSFAEELTRAIRSLESKETDSIIVGAGSALHRVNVPDIVYVESKKHQNIVHTLSETFSYTGALRDLEQQLSGKGFYRINSYYLANLQHVRGIVGQDAKMSGGDLLRISRARRKEFMMALTDHLGSPLL